MSNLKVNIDFIGKNFGNKQRRTFVIGEEDNYHKDPLSGLET